MSIHAPCVQSDTRLIHLASSEITPREVYEGRRDLLKLMAAGAAPAPRWRAGPARDALAQAAASRASWPRCRGAQARWPVPWSMDKLTPYKDVTTYNNFYEFGTDKDDPARERAHAQDRARGRSRSKAQVKKPDDYDLDDLLKLGAARGAHLPPALRRRRGRW